MKVTVWQVSQGETWREEGGRKGERERTLIIGNGKPQTLYIQSNVYTILFGSPTTYTLYRLRAEQIVSLPQLELFVKLCLLFKALSAHLASSCQSSSSLSDNKNHWECLLFK